MLFNTYHTTTKAQITTTTTTSSRNTTTTSISLFGGRVHHQNKDFHAK